MSLMDHGGGSKARYMISIFRECKIIAKRISQYGRAGHISLARNLFAKLPQKNQLAYNAMLGAFIDAGYVNSARRFLDSMPTRNTASYARMLGGLSQSGKVADARVLFNSVSLDMHSVFSWTAMISCHTCNGEPQLALELFARCYREFFDQRVLPNNYTFSTLFKAAIGCQCLVMAMQLQALAVKLIDMLCSSNVFVMNALIAVHSKLGQLADAELIFGSIRCKYLESWNTMMDGYKCHMQMEKALNIFKLMRRKDILSWNIIISGFVQIDAAMDALQFFVSLLSCKGGTRPNLSTYTLVLTACAAVASLHYGRQIHARVVRAGIYGVSVFVNNALISFYAKCGSSDEMEHVLSDMLRTDTVSWNALIQGYGQNGRAERALLIAERMLTANMYNAKTFVAILTCCSHAGRVSDGLTYFELMKGNYGIEPGPEHYICLVDMLGRAGRLNEAYEVLRSLPVEANLAAWSTLRNLSLVHRDSKITGIVERELMKLGRGGGGGLDDKDAGFDKVASPRLEVSGGKVHGMQSGCSSVI